MSTRVNRWWLVAGALLLLLLLVLVNFFTFWAARSTTEATHSLSTYRAGDTMPANMAPGFTLNYAVNGEERLAAALETALSPELERQPNVGTANLITDPTQDNPAPFLLVDITTGRTWTPLYARATITAQVYFAWDGDAPWPLQEPVIFETSPAIMADGEFSLVDTSWGIISKPAYTDHLADALAAEIAAALQNDVFTLP